MNNEHMIPVNIIDLVNKLNDKTVKQNELQNYIHRIEVIRDYCINSLNAYSKDKNSFLNGRKKISR
jgi:hypothetical protein